MTKSLLLKGLAGVAAVGGAIGGSAVAFSNKDWFGIGDNKAADLNKDGDELSGFSHKELIDKVGLSCGLTGKDIGGETKDCRVKDNGTLNIKIDNKTEEGVTFTDTSKLKVERSKKGVRKE